MPSTRPVWVSLDGVWDSGTSWSTGVKPASGSTAFFTGASQHNVTTAPATTTDTVAIQISRDYMGNIGSDSAPVELQGAFIIHEGQGSLFFQQDAASAMRYIKINSPNNTNAATISSSGGGSILNIIVQDGRVVVDASVTPTFELYVLGQGANVVVGPRALTTANLYQTAGRVASDIDWASINVSGGTFSQETVQVADVRCTGGVCNLNFRDATDGNAEVSGDMFISSGGLVNLTNNSVGNFVITGDLIIGPRGTLKEFKDQTTVTGQTVISGGTIQSI